MTKPIYCEKCVGEIKNRDDLVTATLFFEVVPYHEECYARDLKGTKTLFLNNHPINSFSSNVGSVIFFILGIGWLIFSDGNIKWVTIIFLIPLIYRLYSYIVFERHLEK